MHIEIAVAVILGTRAHRNIMQGLSQFEQSLELFDRIQAYLVNQITFVRSIITRSRNTERVIFKSYACCVRVLSDTAILGERSAPQHCSTIIC